MNELNSTNVTFRSRKSLNGRYDELIYHIDSDTIAILRVPLSGPEMFEILKGRMYVPGSRRHSYRNVWLSFNTPPQYRFLCTSLSQYYQLTYEPHPTADCAREGSQCYVCLTRRLNQSADAKLLDSILTTKQ